MAENLDDGEFWLPPQFLSDDDILMDCNNRKRDKFSREGDAEVYFPFEFRHGFGSFAPYSDLGSPVVSVVCSTETESDEEYYITGLTRKLAHATLQEESWVGDTGLAYENPKFTAMSGSPQSTLCEVLGACGCKQGLSRGSPNCPSRMSLPATNQARSCNETALDLLYAAAGEVARMRVIEEGNRHYQNKGLLVPPRKLSPVSVPTRNLHPTPKVGYHSNQSPAYQKVQVAQFQQLKRQQMMKQRGLSICGQSRAAGHQYQQHATNQMIQNRAMTSGSCTLDLSVPAWPTLQQPQPPESQPGSGMRAVFLGNPSSKREFPGTGVFLPRHIGNSSETRTKPSCSSVLLPNRVLQALSLNLDAMDGHPQLQPRRYNDNFSPDSDAVMKYRNHVLVAQHRPNHQPQPLLNQVVRLPREWTF